MGISRSENMRRIRSKNTIPELTVRSIVRGLGYRGYRIHRTNIAGKPDIAWISQKVAIFVHGCFWHGHDCDEGKRKPKSNSNYWIPKIENNKRRDAKHLAALRSAGWKTLEVWECEMRNTQDLTNRLRGFLKTNVT